MTLHGHQVGCDGEAYQGKEVVIMEQTTSEGTSKVPLPLLRVLVEGRRSPFPPQCSIPGLWL
jgi:hypothetical protein